jgi:ABC-type Fe3+-hydroxamate transport system substrate-binding protein
MRSNTQRIVSLVPSWTETLIAAGENVVGRTRFCIHPVDKVSSIPIVGGTKNVDIEKILNLKPDYVIVDREENKKEVADLLASSSVQVVDSHILDFSSAIQFLQNLGLLLKSDYLNELSQRYLKVTQQAVNREKFYQEILIDGEFQNPENLPIDYVIWKDPFMVIGHSTFIAENLKLAGIILERSEKYPEVSEVELKKHFCFFSSEPFPFQRLFKKLLHLGFQGALVDGEKLSWYGVRNLLFLESCLE